MEVTTKDFTKDFKGKDEFLATCFERFGSMNKNDYEVALFHLLLQNGFKDKTDFDISRELKMPETKVKRLRYESNLVYPPQEDFKQLLLEEFQSKSGYKVTENNRIQFIIKDKMLRQYALNRLEELGSFADSSFNTNIVSVSPCDLLLLIADMSDADKNGKEEFTRIIAKVKKEIKNSKQELPTDGKEMIQKTATSLLGDAIGHFAPRFADFLNEYLANKID
mgnify:CR=1 FL=1